MWKYFLATSDQPHHDAPFGDSFGELDEGLWLRPSSSAAVVFAGNLGGIEGPLSLVKDEYMFGRNKIRTLGVGRDIGLHVTHKGLAAASSSTQLVLKNLDERTVA